MKDIVIRNVEWPRKNDLFICIKTSGKVIVYEFNNLYATKVSEIDDSADRELVGQSELNEEKHELPENLKNMINDDITRRLMEGGREL